MKSGDQDSTPCSATSWLTPPGLVTSSESPFSHLQRAGLCLLWEGALVASQRNCPWPIERKGELTSRLSKVGYSFHAAAGKKEAGSRAAVKAPISGALGSSLMCAPWRKPVFRPCFPSGGSGLRRQRPKGKELVELGSHTNAQCRRGKKIRVWPEKKGSECLVIKTPL